MHANGIGRAKRLPGCKGWVYDAAPTFNMYRRIVPTSTLAVSQLDAHPSSMFAPLEGDHSPAALARFRAEPKGFMANDVEGRLDSKGSQLKANCCWVRLSTVNSGDLRSAVVEALHTIGEVAAGEELTYCIDQRGRLAHVGIRDPLSAKLRAAQSTLIVAAPVNHVVAAVNVVPLRGELAAMRASVEAMLLVYMRAWQQPAYPTEEIKRDELINQMFLMRIMEWPVDTPAGIAHLASSYMPKLRAALALPRHAAHIDKHVASQNKVNFERVPPASSSSTVTPPTYTRQTASMQWALEHFQSTAGARWGAGALVDSSVSSVTKVHLSVHNLTSTLVDEWLAARLEGAEAHFLGSLHLISNLYEQLKERASQRRLERVNSSVDFLLCEAHTSITTALMYLATHIVFVQTDYSTRAPRTGTIIALEPICDFLVSTLDVPKRTRDTELLAECIAVFYESPAHRGRCEQLWREHIDTPHRQPPAPTTRVTPLAQAHQINHIIMTLQHVYLCMMRSVTVRPAAK
jgi:hypothetical protein